MCDAHNAMCLQSDSVCVDYMRERETQKMMIQKNRLKCYVKNIEELAYHLSKKQ